MVSKTTKAPLPSSSPLSSSNKAPTISAISFVGAVRRNEYDLVVHYLARHPTYINAQDPDNGLSGLHVAARDGNVPLVKLLLAHRAKVKLTDRQGDSALHYACYRGQTPVIRLLINQGADINGVNNKGFTPVFLSAWKGWTGSVSSRT